MGSTARLRRKQIQTMAANPVGVSTLERASSRAPEYRGSFVLLCLVALIAGCVRRPPSPTAELDAAQEDARSSDASARTLALAGFHALLVAGDAARAQQQMDAALRKNPGEPYALYGQMVLARRVAHPERAVAAALELCQRNGKHPLASVAARYLLDLAGGATSFDDEILARAPKALAAGLAGDAAHLLRSAIASIQGQRGHFDLQAAALREMGAPDRAALYGPFSAYRVLGFDEPTPAETGGDLSKGKGPFGALVARTLEFPDGRVSLAGEPAEGDIYLLAFDVEAAAEADYALRVVTSASHKAFLDGQLLFESRNFQRLSSTVHERGVRLSAGKHRLLVKLLKEEHAATVTLTLLRLDGQPSQLRFTPATGPAPKATSALIDRPLTFAEARDLFDALKGEAGDALAEAIAIRDGLGRDRDATKRLMADLEKRAHAPAVLSLKAELDLNDRGVPHKVARGRGTRDLEAVVEKDPGDIAAILERAAAALEDNRLIEASELAKQARTVANPIGFPIPMIEARIQLALGVDAQADQLAAEAAQLRPGLCEALSLRYDLARRRDAVKAADGWLGKLSSCPGQMARVAEHARLRGDLAKAVGTFEQQLQREPYQVSNAFSLVGLYIGLRRFDDAVALLERQRVLWPRNANVLKRLADVTELQGHLDEATALRVQALTLDGTDLSLRRAVTRAKTGNEPLADYAIDGKKAIAEYQAQPGFEDSAVAYVLDAAAIRAFPDGSMLDRIHVIQKALDQSGTSEIGEVQVPPGAQLLALRTLKPDGTTLEPENIENKDTVSLPGVQIGDFVEYEYLLAHPSRGPAQPGFTAGNFYYQIARTPNHWSTYTVIAPKGAGMGVDAHNVTAETPQVRGDTEVFIHEERNVPPYIPEPDSPPSANEYLPFVAVGSGTTGNAGVVSAYADAFLDRGQLSYEIDQFAQQASAGKTGLEAVKAVYAAVMEKLSGRDSGLTTSATASLSQDRGSRLWALKSSLEAIGIPTRMAIVRTFGADPAPYRYPAEWLLPYLCLRAEVPGTGSVWLDPLVRFGPFGQLPEQATGGRETWLLPEPGRAIEKVKSPVQPEVPGKEVRLSLKLSAEGKLTGEGVETYRGFEAARLAEALESLSPDQRNQALQSALSRYFGGADLSSLKLDIQHRVAAPLSVRYAFTAPHFARVDGDTLALGAITFPAHLGRRFVQTGRRKVPLFIDETEKNHTVVELEVPPGMKVAGSSPEIRAASAWGSFRRTEQQTKNVFHVEEWYRLDMARVPPDQYEAFAQFAGEVDLIQARDLAVQKQ